MKTYETNSAVKNDNYTSIRVKKNTKKDVNKFLDRANKTEDCGKITFDALISYFLENVTKDDIEKLQLQSITWAHEDKRLWEKKKGKVSENKWKEMLYLGQSSEFISKHSRLETSYTS
ncbi:hypothetical protein DAY19_08495 [Halobacteriovorax vibrionivorans]|uniref:Uncharacterized protein n=1 Tax=Halobacteriovorax vibrionivorans TaxID=2152716 RepID=A0ABY0IFK4_9BACT|nr:MULTISPECIES: hypothetical protein [Halobacteriovorax]RZF21718.1 hypothetical protein DAY19_08495 [Halobacteriovorax vibrionivorans]TGD45683.1 hypothetical protein EP118_14940 [Halobacteriovorax sp. Y22]